MTDNEIFTIEAFSRTESGKSYTRKLRKAGKVPAVLLEKGKSTLIELDPKYLPKAWKFGDRKFNLSFNGKTTLVRIHELQVDPVKRHCLHVDLMNA
ncbi:MAG: 50S ribosomal protein L25 [Proteobacteria bacterium]|nr:50S ribosomal protein L25 [Pseudomonadota bacterium]